MGVRLMLREEVSSVRSSWRYSYQGRQDIPQVRGQGRERERVVCAIVVHSSY